MKSLLTSVILILMIISGANAQTVVKEQVKYIAVTPTVDTAVYASGDDIGGKLTFTNAVCSTASTFSVVSVAIADKAAEAIAYDLVLFKSNPSLTTFSDNQALDIDDGDLAKVLPIINIATTDQFTFADNSVSSLSSLRSGGFVTATGGTLYGALVARGAADYDAVDDIIVTLGIVCN